jgi:hypothetical protein
MVNYPGHRTILCIDEDDGILRYQEALFERRGYKVLTAASAREGDEGICDMTHKSSSRTKKEQVAAILQRCTCDIIEDWLGRVKKSKELNEVTLTDEERTGYLPKLIDDLIVRLRQPNTTSEESDAPRSEAAAAHGKMRRSQGYSLGMLLHDSRLLEVALFETLQKNLSALELGQLLPDVMTIADEVDSQLTQAMGSHTKVARNQKAA